MRSLYIAHTGMTEPLAQSQILPYLIGLARRGAEIEILSHEPEGARPDALEAVRADLERERIRWIPQKRSPSHGLGRKVLESAAGTVQGLRAALRARPDVVHARSYLPAAMADIIASSLPGARLLFDCRGMLGDEYVDCGYWTTDRLEYRLLKAYERRLFRRTDGLVVLTRRLERWLLERGDLGRETAVTVIPCCVDMDRFRPDEEARARARRDLGLEGRLTVAYSGSLGTWYLEREMAAFFAAVQRLEPEARWLVLTQSDATSLERSAASAGVAPGSVVVRRAKPSEMPFLLAAGDIGMSFIQSCFSKRGSSPTKVAEYLACGMPVVVNGDIGDQTDLAPEKACAVVLDGYGDEELASAAARAVRLATVPWVERMSVSREGAARHFSLTGIGVPRYEALYRALVQTRSARRRDAALGTQGVPGTPRP